MRKRFLGAPLVVSMFSGTAGAEVLDVNGDGIVGPDKSLYAGSEP